MLTQPDGQRRAGIVAVTVHELWMLCGVIDYGGLLVERRLTDVVVFDPQRGVGLDQTPLRVLLRQAHDARSILGGETV